VTDRWLSRLEVSVKYGPSAKTLANWASLDKGPPFVRIGGRARYREDLVEMWLARQPRGGDAMTTHGAGKDKAPDLSAASRA
jgi:hypothetical protein